MTLRHYLTLFLSLALALHTSAQQQHRSPHVRDVFKTNERKAYKMLSLDNKNYNISVFSDWLNGKIVVSIGSDSLCINYWYRSDVKVEKDKRLLILTHGVRLGIGQHLDKTIILAIKDEHFIQCLSFSSYYREVATDWGNLSASYKPALIEYTLDSVHYKITNEAGYHIHAHTTIKKYATDDISRNYFRNSTVELKFDNSLNVFYQDYLNLHVDYERYSDLNYDTKSIFHLNGLYPRVMLGETNYVFVEGKWYTADDRILSPVVERCN